MAIPAFIARHLGEQAYRTRIARGLTEAHERPGAARHRAGRPARRRVLRSPSRGRRRGRRLPPLRARVSAALGCYLEQGYRLFLLGDVEELWENSAAQQVIEHYGAVIALEARVHARDRLRRFYGNHDEEWRRRWLGQQVPGRPRPGTAGQRGAALVIHAAGKPAGHAVLRPRPPGDADSATTGGAISRLLVRCVWRPLQRRTRLSAHDPGQRPRPARQARPRDDEWARTQEPAPRAGRRAHAPAGVRRGQARPAADAAGRGAEAAPGRRKAGRRRRRGRAPARRARVRARERAAARPVRSRAPPCYFNTGLLLVPRRRHHRLEFADGRSGSCAGSTRAAGSRRTRSSRPAT